MRVFRNPVAGVVRAAAAVASMAVATGGCSGSTANNPTSTKCITGEQVACACLGGTMGVQLCQGDGTYGECECSPPASQAGDGGAGDGGTAANDGAAAPPTGEGGSSPATDASSPVSDGSSTMAMGDGSPGGSGGADSGAEDGGGGSPVADAGFDPCSPFASESIENGEYIVQTNEWNSTLPQCLSVTDAGFTVTEANFDLPPGSPATYPSIYKGCHWGNCTDGPSSGMPVEVDDIGSATTSWSTTEPATGTYDVAYDIWFNQTPTTTGQPDGAELMIWISEANETPGGTLLGEAQIAGATWEVSEMPMATWTYVAYMRVPTTPVVTNLDMAPFIEDSISRGIIVPTWYLIDVEAGFEIWQGGQGLAVNSFSVDIENGSEACGPLSCGGCCSGTTCEAGTDPGACGVSGGQCAVCSSGQTCGAGQCTTPSVCPATGETATMIDDGSTTTASATIVSQCGRAGGWYTFADPTSTQLPASGDPVPRTSTSPPNDVSAYVETTGTLSNYQYYGAGIGFALDAPSGTNEPYDVTPYAYTGISFWLRVAEAPADQPTILFQVLDTTTGATQNGEYYFQAQLEAPAAGVWTKYTFPWDSLAQDIETEISLDLTSLIAVEWQFNGTAPGTNVPQPFDVAVGDIEFTQ
jgi:hypothetical protein